MDDVLARRYRLGAELGRGGMARVVVAHDLRLDRQVAVKLLPLDVADPAGAARFVREARSSARFSHPHAVAIYDAGAADEHLYLVMELVDGPSLAAVLAAEGPLAVDRAQRIADEVLQALAAAHRAGIVHRDVKPANVLLTRQDEAKLADFGIAKGLDDLSDDLTMTGQFIGTPKYLAPERTAGAALTPASDIYAAGLLLFEMLAGRAPFDEATPLATAIAHRDASVPDLRALRPAVAAALAATVEQALAKDPDRRFASADDMRHALAAPAAAPEPVLLPPTQVMPRPPRDRRRVVWLVAAAAILTLVTATVAALAVSDDDPEAEAPSSAPVTTVVPAPTAPPSTPPPTTTVPPTVPPTTQPPPPPAPSTLGELVAFVDASPTALGERGDDLREKLVDVMDEDRRQPREARQLREQVAEWVDEGQLPADVGALVDAVLAPIADQAPTDEDDD